MAEYERKKRGKEKGSFFFSRLSTAEKAGIVLAVLSSRSGALSVLERWQIGEEAWAKRLQAEEEDREKRRAFWTSTRRSLGANVLRWINPKQ